MNIVEFLLYLIYGFSMVMMGIFAIMQKDSKIANFSLIRSIKYLGYFGIIHGTSEWVTMIMKLELCYPYLHTPVSNINLILKALSFMFLLYFGLDLLPMRTKYRSILLKIPLFGFLVFLLGFCLLIYRFGADYHVLNAHYKTITVRYFMAVPSCAIAAAALYLNARLIEKTKSVKISKRYMNLAWIFIAYGCVEGLLVSKAAFFPANVLYKELFPEYFSIMTLSFKAFVGFIVVHLLLKVIDTFSWEQEERLYQLEKMRISSEERRKLGLEIHDSIIQELYAMGLKIEYLTRNKDQASAPKVLEEIKGNITATINKVREFISYNALDEIELERFKDSLEQLVRKYNETQGIKIELKCKLSPYIAGDLLADKTTQIYYIVQEAITNVVKHSQADHAEVLMEGTSDSIYITITDNGIGIAPDIKLEQQYGIRSMKERAKRINGIFKIEKLIKGTRIELRIPSEGVSI